MRCLSGREELHREGQQAKMPPLGMMVEVPAAALTIDDFDADFFSIGSNDLIQYVAAASRDEPNSPIWPVPRARSSA